MPVCHQAEFVIFQQKKSPLQTEAGPGGVLRTGTGKFLFLPWILLLVETLQEFIMILYFCF